MKACSATLPFILMMALCLVGGVFPGLHLVSQVFAANDAPIDVQAELQKIDGYIHSGPDSPVEVPKVTALKPRDIYRNYITQASGISHQLFHLKKETDAHQGTLSLQRLSALTQALAAENANFRQKITHGEDQLQSYQLIQTAVTTLEDTVAYWRVSNRYRSLYRGTAWEKAEDDEVLRTKLEAAFQAIETLKTLDQVRKELEDSLKD